MLDKSFWSYLWGIEMHSPDNQQELHLIRFDLTYEGLKYDFMCFVWKSLQSFWSYLWGIEIQNHSTNIPTFVIRFDLTYEGLKYTENGIIEFDKISFDLTYEGLKLFLLFFRHIFISSVLILPMRDWNMTSIRPGKPAMTCFDLTYEGLKFDNLSSNTRVSRSFWSYLWGIEIRSQ